MGAIHGNAYADFLRRFKPRSCCRDNGTRTSVARTAYHDRLRRWRFIDGRWKRRGYHGWQCAIWKLWRGKAEARLTYRFRTSCPSIISASTSCFPVLPKSWMMIRQYCLRWHPHRPWKNRTVEGYACIQVALYLMVKILLNVVLSSSRGAVNQHAQGILSGVRDDIWCLGFGFRYQFSFLYCQRSIPWGVMYNIGDPIILPNHVARDKK